MSVIQLKPVTKSNLITVKELSKLFGKSDNTEYTFAVESEIRPQPNIYQVTAIEPRDNGMYYVSGTRLGNGKTVNKKLKGSDKIIIEIITELPEVKVATEDKDIEVIEVVTPKATTRKLEPFIWDITTTDLTNRDDESIWTFECCYRNAKLAMEEFARVNPELGIPIQAMLTNDPRNTRLLSESYDPTEKGSKSVVVESAAPTSKTTGKAIDKPLSNREKNIADAKKKVKYEDILSEAINLLDIGEQYKLAIALLNKVDQDLSITPKAEKTKSVEPIAPKAEKTKPVEPTVTKTEKAKPVAPKAEKAKPVELVGTIPARKVEKAKTVEPTAPKAETPKATAPKADKKSKAVYWPILCAIATDKKAGMTANQLAEKYGIGAATINQEQNIYRFLKSIKLTEGKEVFNEILKNWNTGKVTFSTITSVTKYIRKTDVQLAIDCMLGKIDYKTAKAKVDAVKA